VKDGVCAGAGAEHEAVPGSEDFVVEMGADAPGAGIEQLLFGGGEERLLGGAEVGLDDAEDVEVGEWLGMAMIDEIAARRDTEMAGDNAQFVGIEEGSEIGLSPAIEFAFLPFAIGVLGGVESAVGMSHVTEDITEDIAGDVGEPGLTAEEEGIEVERNELRVVVKHFLEVWHEPFGVDGVTGEPAADLIVHAAGGHPFAGVQHHADGVLVLVQSAVSEQKSGLTGAREFWGVAETAVTRVIFRFELLRGVVEEVGGDRQIGGGFGGGETCEFPMDAVGGLEEIVWAFVPELLDLEEELGKTGTAVVRTGRKVGATEERFAVGGEKGGERPAALTGGSLDEAHVNLVDVGPFFAIDLDADEMVIEDAGDVGVFERFPFHDVAPVAGRITDAEEDWFVLLAGAGERFIAPGKPVDGIVLVLEEVWRLFPGEAIGGWGRIGVVRHGVVNNGGRRRGYGAAACDWTGSKACRVD
jgi:hypothetical protein